MERIRWVNAGEVSSWRSQSIYHGLAYAQNKDSGNTIALAIPSEPYVCLGYFQDAAQEFDLGYCAKNNLPVIRRETGGGGVYIDRNQLFVQWVFQKKDVPTHVNDRFEWFLKPMIETYRFFGIDAYYYPVNDVHVNGRKIVGTGAAMIGEAEVLTGNFILDFNIEAFYNTLNLPNETFKKLVQTSLKEYMGNMKEDGAEFPKISQLISKYKTFCEAHLKQDIVESNHFTWEEEDWMLKVEKKFKSPQWLAQTSSPSQKVKVLKIHAGVWVLWAAGTILNQPVEIMLRVRENTLDQVVLEKVGEERLGFNSNEFNEYMMGTSFEELKFKKHLTYFFRNRELEGMIDDWIGLFLIIKNEWKKKGGG